MFPYYYVKYIEYLYMNNLIILWFKLQITDEQQNKKRFKRTKLIKV